MSQHSQDASFPSWPVNTLKKGKFPLRNESIARSRIHESKAPAESKFYRHKVGYNFAHTLDSIEEAFATCNSPKMPFKPVLETPFEPLEFLSRSWSSASAEVVQSLSPSATSIYDQKRRLTAANFLVDAGMKSPMISPCPSNLCRSSTDRSLTSHKGLSTLNEVEEISDEGFSSASKKIDELQAWLWMQQSMHPEMSLGRCFHKKWFTNCNMGSLKNVLSIASIFKRWFKDVKEKRKEEDRLQTAQVHAAMSVAGVAAAIAALAAANNSDEDQFRNKTDVAVASAAALVAAQCVEVAEAMGADHHQVSSLLNSAVTVKSAGDILTLTAEAATSLREAATLKSRPKGAASRPREPEKIEDIPPPFAQQNFYRDFSANRELLLKGTHLPTRVSNGKPQGKIVSVFLSKQTQAVILKLTSKHLAGAFTTSKESSIFEVIQDVPYWPQRCLNHGEGHLCYFGVNTSKGIVEFEFKDKINRQLWIFTISQLLKLSTQRKHI